MVLESIRTRRDLFLSRSRLDLDLVTSHKKGLRIKLIEFRDSSLLQLQPDRRNDRDERRDDQSRRAREEERERGRKILTTRLLEDLPADLEG